MENYVALCSSVLCVEERSESILPASQEHLVDPTTDTQTHEQLGQYNYISLHDSQPNDVITRVGKTDQSHVIMVIRTH